MSRNNQVNGRLATYGDIVNTFKRLALRFWECKKGLEEGDKVEDREY